MGSLISSTIEQKTGKEGMDTSFEKADSVYTDTVAEMPPTRILAAGFFFFFSLFLILGYFVYKKPVRQLGKMEIELEKRLAKQLEKIQA
jgi:hypothetical protein